MSDDNSDQYFAAKPGEECASILISKADSWVNNLESNGYLEKLRRAWSMYVGAYYSDISNGHQITFSGTEGELANLAVNHLRNLAQHILVMVTSTRPTMEARATNTDYKSLTQTILANGLLDYYMREKRLERYLKNAVEYAIVLGSGYVKMSWNATSGELYDFNEETQTPIYEGDAEFTVFSPFDVIVDSSKESQDHDWQICRSWKNRFDLAAKYPEFFDDIKKIPTKTDMQRIRFTGLGNDVTDDIAVYEFYHRRSEALPDGRYMLFLSDDIVLYDGPLPYRTIPLYRISPADILGTPYGYTSIFDLMPIQEAYNSLMSTVLTNQSAFGVQNLLVPRGSDIAINQLAGGLNVIECNTQVGKPEALNLCHTPEEVFKFIEMLEKTLETISGVNSVARGNPEASLKSGAALALVQSMSIQFLNGLQQSFVELVEDVGTALINMLKDYAAVPRVAAIAGRSNRTYMKEFKGDDLNNVNRVIVDVGNPLARTTAGRVEMAQQLLQMGAIKTPNDYFTVMNTGKLESMTEGVQAEMMLIKGENEKMLDGKSVNVLDIDDHKNHIMEHKAILSDPDLRQDPNLTQIVLKHIQEHIDALRQADPDLLQLLGQQPLHPPGMQQGGPPPGGMPPGPPQPQGPQQGPPPGPQHGPPHGPPHRAKPAPNPNGPPPQPGTMPPVPNPAQQGVPLSPGAQNAGIHLPKIPGPAHPPGQFAHLPTNPADVPMN